MRSQQRKEPRKELRPVIDSRCFQISQVWLSVSLMKPLTVLFVSSVLHLSNTGWALSFLSTNIEQNSAPVQFPFLPSNFHGYAAHCSDRLKKSTCHQLWMKWHNRCSPLFVICHVYLPATKPVISHQHKTLLSLWLQLEQLTILEGCTDSATIWRGKNPLCIRWVSLSYGALTNNHIMNLPKVPRSIFD